MQQREQHRACVEAPFLFVSCMISGTRLNFSEMQFLCSSEAEYCRTSSPLSISKVSHKQIRLSTVSGCVNICMRTRVSSPISTCRGGSQQQQPDLVLQHCVPTYAGDSAQAKELFLHFTAENISTQQTALNQALLTTENETRQRALQGHRVCVKLPSRQPDHQLDAYISFLLIPAYKNSKVSSIIINSNRNSKAFQRCTMLLVKACSFIQPSLSAHEVLTDHT